MVVKRAVIGNLFKSTVFLQAIWHDLGACILNLFAGLHFKTFEFQLSNKFLWLVVTEKKLVIQLF